MKIEIMKKLVLMFSVLLLSVVALNAQEVQKQTKGAAISAPEEQFDFGTIKEADGPVTHAFTLKNVGNAPLVITRASASCGCTKPKFSTEPIAPGKSTKIEVTYNPAGRPGQFVKTVAVYSNGKEGALILRIKGVVE